MNRTTSTTEKANGLGASPEVARANEILKSHHVSTCHSFRGSETQSRVSSSQARRRLNKPAIFESPAPALEKLPQADSRNAVLEEIKSLIEIKKKGPKRQHRQVTEEKPKLGYALTLAGIPMPQAQPGQFGKRVNIKKQTYGEMLQLNNIHEGQLESVGNPVSQANNLTQNQIHFGSRANMARTLGLVTKIPQRP